MGVKVVSAPEDLTSCEAGTAASQLPVNNYSCRRGHENSSLGFQSTGDSCRGWRAKQPPCQAFKRRSVRLLRSGPPKVGILCIPLFVPEPIMPQAPRERGKDTCRTWQSRIFLFALILFPRAVFSPSLLLWPRSFLAESHSQSAPVGCSYSLCITSNTPFPIYSRSVCI